MQRNKQTIKSVQNCCIFGWPSRNELSRELMEIPKLSCILQKHESWYPQRWDWKLLTKFIMVIKAYSNASYKLLLQFGGQEFLQLQNTLYSLVKKNLQLMMTALPNYPWEWIAVDLFELKGCHYLLVADYFSRFIEVQKLILTTMTVWNEGIC